MIVSQAEELSAVWKRVCNMWTLLIIILAINTITALLYLLWGLLRPETGNKDRGHRGKYIMLSFVILICPLVGPCFLGFSHLLFLIFSRRDVDMKDVSFSRKRAKIYVKADVERDINMAPMQEVLIISDVRRRRKMLLDVAKKDIRKSLGTIAIALENSDSETSHYAASLIMDALSEFKATVQNMLMKQRQDPEDCELGMLLFQYIGEVLRQEILSEEEKRSYTYTMEEVLSTVFRYKLDLVEGTQYRWIIEALVEIKDFPEAEKWARRSMKYRNYQLDSYIGCMKLYFTYGDRDSFLQCVRRLQDSGIVVNKEVMELIRIFRV